MTESWMRRALDVKRDGGALESAVWERVVSSYVAGTVDEAPVAALLMAAAIRGLDGAETYALTDAMIRSGDTIVFDRFVIDKHSSGGVGDSVSLAAVPLVAACGVAVAKLSGRALGHTGGTLDKLESIPGFRTDLSLEAFHAQVGRIGCAIAAQSAHLVPADKLLYGLRDRTGSVPSIGLIAASIVSKKIAGGAAAVVYDVKVGRGAFMRSVDDARELARVLVDLSARFGRRASALVTDMDEPLGPSIGNALEVIEARDFLLGTQRDPRLAEVVHLIAAEMLRVGGVDAAEAGERLERALRDGSAFERFVALVEAQGGSRAGLLGLRAPAERAVARATRSGSVAAVDAIALGQLARDAIDAHGSAAGIIVRVRTGDTVRAGDPLAEFVGAGSDAAVLADAFRIADGPVERRPLLAAAVRDAAATVSSNRLDR